MENIQTGLLLMVVGMITVFVILLIVIFGSKGLISLVNKIVPPEEVPVKSASGPDAKVEKVLQAAVATITGGKGRIVKISKI